MNYVKMKAVGCDTTKSMAHSAVAVRCCKPAVIIAVHLL
jgi:hypothetical protein